MQRQARKQHSEWECLKSFCCLQSNDYRTRVMTEADFGRQMEQTALGNTVCYTWARMWMQRENYRLRPWEENSFSSLEDLEVPKTASLFPLSPTQGFLGHLSGGDNCTNSTLVFGFTSNYHRDWSWARSRHHSQQHLLAWVSRNYGLLTSADKCQKTLGGREGCRGKEQRDRLFQTSALFGLTPKQTNPEHSPLNEIFK